MRIPPELEQYTLNEVIEAVVRHCAKVCRDANLYDPDDPGGSFAIRICDEFGLKP